MHYLQKELTERINSDSEIAAFLRQSAAAGISYLDLTDQEHEWRDAKFWTILGYDPANMSESVRVRQDIGHPEDIKAAEQLIAEHCAHPSVPYEQVVRYTHADGYTVWLHCRGLAIREENGKPIRLLVAHVDVTAEKEQEELLLRSQEIARIGTWEVNLTKGTIFWNELTRLIHEVEPDFQPDMETAINFYREGDSRRIITELLDHAIATGESFDTELQLVTAKGRNVWVRAVGQAKMINGKCHRITGVFQDIDDRKKAEERLLNYSILESKSKEMEQFSYAASHDLREPLLTIRGYVDVITEDYADELSANVKGFLKTISGATQRMDDLIKGLLDYSRLSTVKQWQPIDMNELVRQVLTDLGSATRVIEVNINCSDLPNIHGYPLELKLLVQNLLSNAIRYRRKEIPLQVDITWGETNEHYQFSIADNGIGIADNQRENIFQLFRQLHLQEKFGGSGIGLANGKKIVELHGGEIWVDSTPGKGATFHFTVMKHT